MIKINGTFISGSLPPFEFENPIFAGRVRFYSTDRNHVRLYVQNEFMEIFSDRITIVRLKKLMKRIPRHIYSDSLTDFLNQFLSIYASSKYNESVR